VSDFHHDHRDIRRYAERAAAQTVVGGGDLGADAGFIARLGVVE